MQKHSKLCAWCGEKEATEQLKGHDYPVYCEECQRMLLKKYGTDKALREWENKRGKKNEDEPKVCR